MAGNVNQEDIESVFEDLMSAEIEKMSEEDRETPMRFYLTEALRFGADYILSRTDEEIENMTEAEKMIMREYYSREAKRFTPQDLTNLKELCEDEVDEERRHFREVSAKECKNLRESVVDMKEENAQIAEKNSINRELLTLMKERNTLMNEEECIRQEMIEVEKEPARLRR